MTTREAEQVVCPGSGKACAGLACGRWSVQYGIDGKSSPCDMAHPENFDAFLKEVAECRSARALFSCSDCRDRECPGFFNICLQYRKSGKTPQGFLMELRQEGIHYSACRMCAEAHGTCGRG